MKIKPLPFKGSSSDPLSKPSTSVSFEAKEAVRTIHCNKPEVNLAAGFAQNSIKTTKYTLLTFLPKNLFEQFRRIANTYFLIVACIQLVPTLSPVNPYSSIFPLIFVLTVTAVKEAVEDYKRNKSDKTVNARPVQTLKGEVFTSIEWKDVVVGDIVHVNKGEPFPADLFILNSSETHGLCYIETSNLDGETNLKLFQALPETTHLYTEKDLASFSAVIEAEPPNNRLYNFSGSITINNSKEGVNSDGANPPTKLSVGVKQVLLRGSVLKNTDWISGVVIYCGKETKLMQNATNPPSKRTTLEKETNKALIRIFAVVMIICLIGAFGSGIWSYVIGQYHWYLDTDPNMALTGFMTFFTFMISFSVMIPISLYVSMEMVKVAQAFMIGYDLAMYYEDNDTPAKARTSNLSEELGQIEYIFSDKTGTLTRNQMEFLKCSINGVSYGNGLTEIAMTKAKREGRTIEQDNSPPLPGADPKFSFKDRQLLHDLETNHNTSIMEFFSLLAVCHTVVPEVDENSMNGIRYQAASPDEGALVDAARNVGFNFHTRNPKDIVCDIRGIPTRYEILALLEFNSTRKRMSVICRNPLNGLITLYCKGADTVILARLREGQDKLANATLKHLEEYANDGLRTLCLAYTTIDEKVFEEWYTTFKEASVSLVDREEKLAQVAELIEKDLILLGATAIEDKLQVGVPDAILSLARAGLKIWVLTGDKQETAINIGFACSLLTSSMTIMIVNSVDEEETGRQLESAMAQREEAGGEGGSGSGSGEFGLVIDGLSLGFALHAYRPLLLKLATSCKAVLCCRVSPLQKAQVVGLVRDGHKKVTLAIGDGANDVSMIQQAHIGVGISGQEGMQAVMSSDYAIAQFRFLQQLLLVHGRWSYKRVTKLILYSFYKNMVFALSQFWYNWFTGFSGQTMYDGWSITIFNVAFTGLPIIVYAIFEQDVSPKKVNKYPRLYESGQKGDEFSMKLLYLWLLNAVYQSLIIFFFGYLYYTEDPTGRNIGLWGFGAAAYAAVVLTVTARLALEIHHWTWITAITTFGSAALWFFWMLLMCSFEVFITDGRLYQVATTLFRTAFFWLGLIATVFLCLLPNMAIKYLQREYKPESYQIVQEEEMLEQQHPSPDNTHTKSYNNENNDSNNDNDNEGMSHSSSQNFAIRKAMKTMSFQTSSSQFEERFTGFAFSDEQGAQEKLNYSFKRQNTEHKSNRKNTIRRG